MCTEHLMPNETRLGGGVLQGWGTGSERGRQRDRELVSDSEIRSRTQQKCVSSDVYLQCIFTCIF